MLHDKKISITYMSGPLDGKILRFDQPDPGGESVLTIGRRDGCDIHLAYDSQVSRLHARLGCAAIPVSASESVSDPYLLNFWLEDCGSRNGTFIEKEQVEGRANLRPGTLIRIGRTWLRLDVPFSFDEDDPLF
ncbi:MAG: FHA domain-containing protein [Anaerolineae bacterium]|nr:FHA domain-containing protein [Anaerolineae bacterium]